MADLIDRSVILCKNCHAPAKGNCSECDWNGDSHCSCEIFGVQLANAPAVDAKPVVHSLWVGGRFRLIDGVYEERCLRCGEWSDEYDKPFCPNCGADMRGET